MRIIATWVFFTLGLAAAGPVWAEQWFNVSAPTEHEKSIVEVDLDSVRMRGQSGEGAIRVSFDAPHSHPGGFGFRSFVASAQFDCQRRSVALSSAAYYSQPSAQGQRVGNDSAGKDAGMPSAILESIPAAARQALLKAACATTQTSAA